jgi:hypothetical protein
MSSELISRRRFLTPPPGVLLARSPALGAGMGARRRGYAIRHGVA